MWYYLAFIDFFFLCLHLQVFDAVVGDIAIVTDRTKIVDFTQPYIEFVVASVKKLNSNTLAFL